MNFALFLKVVGSTVFVVSFYVQEGAIDMRFLAYFITIVSWWLLYRVAKQYERDNKIMSDRATVLYDAIRDAVKR